MNTIEIKFSNGDTVIIEDKADHAAIGQALAENGHFSSTRIQVGMSATVKTPITILERSVVYLQPRA